MQLKFKAKRMKLDIIFIWQLINNFHNFNVKVTFQFKFVILICNKHMYWMKPITIGLCMTHDNGFFFFWTKNKGGGVKVHFTI